MDRAIQPQEKADDKRRGPVRTLKVGDRITVYGDLEVIAVEGQWVTVRAAPASAPPPAAVMFPAGRNSGTTELNHRLQVDRS